MEEKQILVVDDDENICRLLKMYLDNEGFKVFVAYDGAKALEIFNKTDIDLIILDIMLPVTNGWEVCRTVRKTSTVPIIMLTARDMLEDKLQGFDYGADDYMVKPFETKELVARVKARLRDKPEAEEESGSKPVLSAGNLMVDLGRYQVKLGQEIVELKPKEIQLLYFLLQHQNMGFFQRTAFGESLGIYLLRRYPDGGCPCQTAPRKAGKTGEHMADQNGLGRRLQAGGRII